MSLAKELENGDLKDKVEKVIRIFYEEKKEDENKEEKEDKNKEKKKDKNKVKIYSLKNDKREGLKDLENYKNVVFYAISIDGEPIWKNEEYLNLIKKKILEEKLKKGNRIVCYVCGKNVDEYYDSFERLKLKIYINDKIGFSQKLSDNWHGNFAVCRDCYVNLIKGQNFILNELSGKIGKINYLVIPEFIKQVEFSIKHLEHWSNEVKDINKNLFELFEYQKFKNKLNNYIQIIDKNYFNLNYIFYEQERSQFKVYNIVRDVPIGRIEKVIEDFNIIGEIFGFLEKEYKLNSLGDIYFLVPSRVSGGKLIDIRKIVDLFVHILNNYPIAYESLISDFVLGAKSIYFENKQYHIVEEYKNSNTDLVRYIIKTNQLLTFLKVLEEEKGGSAMRLDNYLDDYREYMQKCSLSPKEQALFLLGVAIAKIGALEYKDYGYKPVLNKINFNGMNIQEVKNLYIQVFEKIKQRELYSAEKFYSESKELFNQHMKSWDLNPLENTYYIISGYAFETHRIMTKGGQDEQNKQ
ncbi:MAG: TIGR02556 family CRISPR-associated protein [candidate division WOR-3 bacterium]|nr:TIGR02556 family CRISPR-associated protein [candidate division WOR-3 bacterium]